MKIVNFMNKCLIIKELKKDIFEWWRTTLVENMYDLLQKFIDNNWAKDIELEYNINLTNIPRAICYGIFFKLAH